MIINEEVMTNYLEQIVLLLNEILDVSIPFWSKVVKKMMLYNEFFKVRLNAVFLCNSFSCLFAFKYTFFDNWFAS
jgi:hypothetical protein